MTKRKNKRRENDETDIKSTWGHIGKTTGKQHAAQCRNTSNTRNERPFFECLKGKTFTAGVVMASAFSSGMVFGGVRGVRVFGGVRPNERRTAEKCSGVLKVKQTKFSLFLHLSQCAFLKSNSNTHDRPEMGVFFVISDYVGKKSAKTYIRKNQPFENQIVGCLCGAPNRSRTCTPLDIRT